MNASSLFDMWRHLTTELSNGFVTQSAIPSKRKADMPNVPSISYGFFAEYCIRGKRRRHLINACVVGILKGNKEKNPFGFQPKIYSAPSCEVRKISVIAKQRLVEIGDY